MTVFDVHTHAFEASQHMSDDFSAQAARVGWQGARLTVRLEDYRKTSDLFSEGLRTVVFGGKAKLSGLWTPDSHVAEYCRQDPEHLIPFLSLDPTQPGWKDELREGHQELGMKGIKLLPMYAGFYPCDAKLNDLWEYASQHHLPVLLHTGTTFVSQAPLDCTLPRHLDPVATRYPDCRIILAHLGHPYEGETVAVIRKHPNVYSDVSALHFRPLQLYHSLMLVQEYRVWDKLLFGTDFPFATVNDSIQGLCRLNRMLEGTGLPRLSQTQIEGLIHRGTGDLLGLT